MISHRHRHHIHKGILGGACNLSARYYLRYKRTIATKNKGISKNGWRNYEQPEIVWLQVRFSAVEAMFLMNILDLFVSICMVIRGIDMVVFGAGAATVNFDMAVREYGLYRLEVF